MRSCLYEGWVRHRRWDAVRHSFRFPLFMVYLDLAELPTVFEGRWLWSTQRPALARFRREDHLGDATVPLDRAVRDLVEARTGRRPLGPIRLLTHLRYFGYIFNPISLFYCFDASQERIEAVVADVSNTPWKERDCSVLPTPAGHPARRPLRHRTRKRFHVSPFMEMDLEYAWWLGVPGRRLVVHLENRRAGAAFFDATLVLRRRPITGRSLAGVLLRYPAMTLQVIARIYLEAWRLRRKGAIWYPHPNESPARTEPVRS